MANSDSSDMSICLSAGLSTLLLLAVCESTSSAIIGGIAVLALFGFPLANLYPADDDNLHSFFEPFFRIRLSCRSDYRRKSASSFSIFRFTARVKVANTLPFAVTLKSGSLTSLPMSIVLFSINISSLF